MDHAQDLALAKPEVARDHLRVERAVHLWERSGVCSSCMHVAFPHLVSPPIFRWRVAPLGYLTIRMLSAGVGISGCVVRPVPTVRIGRHGRAFPQDATIPTHAPKPRVPNGLEERICCQHSRSRTSTGEHLWGG
jgi:hypothetical protein